MQTAGKIKRHFGKRALPDDQHPHFLHYASQLADALRHTILVDQVIYPLSTRTEVLELLEEHITENIVKIGRDYYRQIILNAITCNSLKIRRVCCLGSSTTTCSSRLMNQRLESFSIRWSKVTQNTAASFLKIKL
ncbi:hypothetical protein BV25DRAFT_1218030 [Artomyces pyxidatus]|uniref:Uncharacterized protein n=1 Tax=Artomyces pyxidatus TaxID=48021 RepID=A0ACB8SR33_9AGAM|nr:hypothetical protein BV25DRAFT_1218030 [Artomyces pyxidatus]